jgi:nucleotidyltransferase-like protein
MIERSLMETGDLDLLLEARARLRLTLRGAEPSKIIDILKSADSSFEKAANGSSNAANAAGYLVELIKAEPRPSWKEERSALGEDDLQAAAIRNMRWVLNAPRFEVVAVGEDGAPVPIAAAALSDCIVSFEGAVRDSRSNPQHHVRSPWRPAHQLTRAHPASRPIPHISDGLKAWSSAARWPASWTRQRPGATCRSRWFSCPPWLGRAVISHAPSRCLRRHASPRRNSVVCSQCRTRRILLKS